MKRAFLILTTAILLSVNGNCQWLNRHYGVNDFNQLSQEQLNHALNKAQGGVVGGIILSVAGAIGLGLGGYHIWHGHTLSPEGVYYEDLPLGWALVLISSPIEITGLVKLSKSSQRIKSIKEVMKNTELKMGLANYQMVNSCSDSKGSLLPCLSLTIRF
jgi:hypothetical protein